MVVLLSNIRAAQVVARTLRAMGYSLWFINKY